MNEEGSTSGQPIAASIQTLIGNFDLDPHRVLGVVLDALTNRESITHRFVFNSVEKNILDLFNPSHISHVLGFQLSFFVRNSETGVDPTPTSWIALAAALIKSNFISWQALFSYLSPETSDLETDFEAYLKYTRDSARSLTSTALEKKDIPPPKERSYQKFKLIAQLFQAQAFDAAFEIMKELKPYNPTLDPEIRTEISNWIKKKITPYYNAISPVLSIFQKNAPQPEIPFYKVLINELYPILTTLGCQISTDVTLFVKLIRLTKPIFLENVFETLDADEKVTLEDIIQQLFLPAYSLMGPNPAVGAEIFEILKTFSYQTRYMMYSKWKSLATQIPELGIAKSQATKDIKATLRRLSKEKVKPISKQIGRIANTGPLWVAEAILAQIDNYDSQIMPIIADSLRYLSIFAFDVLSYAVLEQLVSGKPKMKPDGINVTQWFQSLTLFCGSVSRKYPHYIEVFCFLQYIRHQLMNGNSVDLLLLKELLSHMAGVDISEDLNNAELEGQCGGPFLRAETHPIKPLKNIKRATSKLKQTLIDHDLLVPILIAVAQQRTAIIFKTEETKHLKLVGDLYDKCQDTLLCYVEFYSQNIPLEILRERIPPVLDLVQKHHIEIETALFISRSFLHLRYTDVAEFKGLEAPTGPDVSSLQSTIEILLPKLVIPKFYTLFSLLELTDVYVPEKRYNEEIQKNENLVKELEKEDSPINNKRKSDLLEKNNKLKAELEKLLENKKQTLSKFNQIKAELASTDIPVTQIVTDMVQNMILPRTVNSLIDAVFSFKFVLMLHEFEVPQVCSLSIWDKILTVASFTVFGCTEREAVRLGVYLNDTLHSANRWLQPEVYTKECQGKLGFKLSFPPQPDTKSLAFEDYLKIANNWHNKIAKSLTACLESPEYMEIRNALLALSKLIENFPIMTRTANHIEKRLTKLAEDQRQDIKMLSTGYLSQITAHQGRLIKGSFQEEHQRKLKGDSKKDSEKKSSSGSQTDSRHVKKRKSEVEEPVSSSKKDEKKPLEEKKPEKQKAESVDRSREVSKKEEEKKPKESEKKKLEDKPKKEEEKEKKSKEEKKAEAKNVPKSDHSKNKASESEKSRGSEGEKKRKVEAPRSSTRESKETTKSSQSFPQENRGHPTERSHRGGSANSQPRSGTSNYGRRPKRY